MKVFGNNPSNANLDYLGLKKVDSAYWNIEPSELIEDTLLLGQGLLTNTGSLAIDTGEFTGRSPKDRFIVKDDLTSEDVFWGDINIPISTEKFNLLYDKICTYLWGKDIYVKDVGACADPNYRLNVRVISEYPWSSFFVDNMFIRLDQEELKSFEPDWHVISAPNFHAIPEKDGTRQHNFAIVNFTEKKIIIGGTGYTGEIKKGIFSVLNYVLPKEKGVFPMHCSVNECKDGETAIFFGLSGTGKTTLSADPNRVLIGDDEHAWTNEGVFNFEGGCYAKTIDLSLETEPEIFNAVQFGSLIENIGFEGGSRKVNFHDDSKTLNTRVSYPIHFIPNAKVPSIGGQPKNIFFLTCDAFGVLPPISKMNKAQAMYHFISGYTAKVAGTEEGINEPEACFSACFGEPFLPLHPAEYANMLGDKMEHHSVNVWLINTGWSGGEYGVGARMKLKYTREMINAALNGDFDNVDFKASDLFNLSIPQSCPNVPDDVLNPRDTWEDKEDYDRVNKELAIKFVENFNKYRSGASELMLKGEPQIK